MRLIRQTTKPQNLRRSKIIQGLNSAGAWTLRIIYGTRASKRLTSKPPPLKPQALRQTEDDAASPSGSVSKSRARRSLASLRVRTGSSPGYQIVSLH